MKTSPRGIALIQEFEGFSPVAYRDPVGIWTIGYGFIEGVKEGDRITKEQGAARLRRELVKYEQAVIQATGGIASQNEFDALVSFAFNCGSGNLASSTLLRKLNQGDYAGAADQFLAWNKARKNGVLVELPGLTRRRRAERALFLGEDWRAVSALRTRGGLPAARTMAPERPEPPPGQDDGSLTAAEAAKKPRRAPKAASKTPDLAATEPASARAKKPTKQPAEKPARKVVEKAVDEEPRAAAAEPAKPRARTTTPKAPPKAPPCLLYTSPSPRDS